VSQSPSIRRATVADAAAVDLLIREFYAIDQHSYDPDLVRRALTPLLVDDTFGVVLLATDPDPVGYAVVCWSYSLESGGRDCCLDEIYVRDRGRGLGAMLLTAAFDAGRAAGALRLFLETEAHNRRVRGFYARHGLRADDSIWMSRDL
jgi:GNAT superfamily N-acetyltransferase